MDIQLHPVQKQEEHVLHNLMQYYIYEFSSYLSIIKVNEDGRYDPFTLDVYWNDDYHHAYFIKVEDELAGFVLVQSEQGEKPNTINEFFVMRGYEGKGIGKVVAKEIFDRFQGNWLVTQSEKNERAKSFWRSVISKYTDGNYSERIDEKKRTIQEFSTV
ncbi:GNAT family N-acetyltransferase [Fredinandcohnia sp. 179-A 10B2 NHS]|uniref:GNAT family N-acetyltransferase n=1 Tax=Fredinandcohnia sp. 179-A 10B2 NHS TaxID=3235176 RepID=UPI0039A23FD5